MHELRFECQRCLHCCGGEPGYVFLTKSDLKRAAEYTGLPEEQFIEIYCRKIDYGTYYMISLKERENYDCVFLSPNGCTIYPARPHQCATYPYWKGLADDDANWEREKKDCPGIGKGKKISWADAKKIIDSNGVEPPIMVMKKF